MIGHLEIAGNVRLSQLVYGMARLANDPDCSPERVRSRIQACIDQNITTMDIADVYGGYTVEETIGNALRGTALRQRVEIVTKCGVVKPVGRHATAPIKYYDTSAVHIRNSVDHSLRLIGTDYIDLLLIHRPDPFIDHLETGAVLDAMVEEGKVRAVGVSNFRPWDYELLQSAMANRLAVNQIQLSLLARDAFTNGDVAFFQQRQIPLMAWSPLAGGRLLNGTDEILGSALDRVAQAHGVDRAAVAVAWLLAHPAQVLPVLGTNNLDRIRNLSKASEVRIDRMNWFTLYAAAMGEDIP